MCAITVSSFQKKIPFIFVSFRFIRLVFFHYCFLVGMICFFVFILFRWWSIAHSKKLFGARMKRVLRKWKTFYQCANSFLFCSANFFFLHFSSLTFQKGINFIYNIIIIDTVQSYTSALKYTHTHTWYTHNSWLTTRWFFFASCCCCVIFLLLFHILLLCDLYGNYAMLNGTLKSISSHQGRDFNNYY